MKFKSLFLGMLGAAALVSCNNDAIENGPVNPNEGNPTVKEGIPIHATMTFKLGGGPATYAGTSAVNSSANESQLKDAAVYIYKSDAAGMTPQCAVYLSSLSNTASAPAKNGDYNTVTLKTTSGSKKIFVAANIKQHPYTTTANMVSITNLGVVSDTLKPLFPALNATLYSISATGFSTTAPATALFADWSDGLIKNLAMNDLYGTGVGTYTGAGTYAPFMTNWDGPVDVAGSSSNNGSADFVLVADVDSAASIPSGLGGTPTYDASKNQFNVYVQRAYAKVSLKFGFAGTTASAPATPANLVGKHYTAAAGSAIEGRFFPWGSGANAQWSLGNIINGEYPFQTYDNGVVVDPYFGLTTDSIHQPATWFLHYDNTRVFPFSATINTYPNAGITVSNTKSTMLAPTNNQSFTGDAEATQTNYNYAYATENARAGAGTPVHDFSAYVIAGGFYQPKTVLTSINRANVASNDPIYGFNGASLTGVTSGSVSGPDFSWVPSANDTLYYVADDKIFIVGRANLMAYYAWAPTQKFNATAGDAWLAANPGQPITAAAVYSFAPGNGNEFGTAVGNAISKDADKKNQVLFAYFEGQCFYRVFVKDTGAASAGSKVAVLRNHIYDVNITAIKGPGIDDPNVILVPGLPVLEQDTYVSVTINVLQWHKVNQNEELDNK